MSDKEISNPVGRPTVITPQIIEKLYHAFAHGATDIQACLYADISKTALYNYQQLNLDFVERKEQLKEQTTLHAKLNIAESIRDGDKQQSNWWLERKARNEFGTRNENINVNIDVKELPEEDRDRLKDLLNG